MALARDAKGEKFKVVVAVMVMVPSLVEWRWKQLTMRSFAQNQPAGSAK